MGRYRSDSSSGDGYSRRSKRKKKRRSRSGSSTSQHSHTSESKVQKRKKSRKHSRSRSVEKQRSHARRPRRSRSGSENRYSSKRTRSTSPSPDLKSFRRSRTPPSKSRKSRSPKSRRRKRRSRSRSGERGKDSRSNSRGKSQSSDRASSRSYAASESLPASFSVMTPSELAEERMRQAFQAVAASDDKVKSLIELQPVKTSFLLDTRTFSSSVAAIESDNFVSTAFKSSRSTKLKEEPSESGYSHEDAIFGSLAISGFTLAPDTDTKPLQLDPDAIMHPSLYCDPGEKMDRWTSRLSQLRKRKLEGQVIS